MAILSQKEEPMTAIFGVDFSGAKNNDPWVTKSVLRGIRLSLESCFPLPREELTKLLLSVCRSQSAVVGMDFPFGLPKAFAEAEYNFEGTRMPQMWEMIADPERCDLPKYIQQIRFRLRRNGNLRRFNKCLRQGDETHFSTIAYSPLNPASPEMFPMTFYGMKMLNTLWKQSNCQVPPLDDSRDGAVLLETMPGAMLDRFGFERSVYKRYKNSADARDLRKEIVRALPSRSRDSGVLLENFDAFTDLCVGVHDCLDSVVAAVAAAMWARDSTRFLHPTDDELPYARLEGWIYVPAAATPAQ